ncbi:hypothetical protein F4820DRAFT_452265 [Hypoxylon rubiginosum]|uniref:Uncharacterized protein n=1 Tax=Hypoxylon rubiginosum TaxID=110542 RepID=A0ACB9YNY4_9PEZI|nr:hypothetical protein F4820DRAFT_452265 [Hypoxylon rubiginosum]
MASDNSNGAFPSSNAVSVPFVAGGSGQQNVPLGNNSVILNALSNVLTGHGVSADASLRQLAKDRAILDRVVVCVACGGVCRPSVDNSPFAIPFVNQRSQWDYPLLIKASPGFWKWCEQPWTSQAYHRNDEHWIQVYQVQHFVGGPEGFTINGVGKAAIDTRDSEMYLPIHRPCFELAKKYCRYQSRFSIDFREIWSLDGGVPSSIAHLYEIWMKRALMALPEQGPLNCPIPEPTQYADIQVEPSLKRYCALPERNNMIQEHNPSDGLLTATDLITERVIVLDEAESGKVLSPSDTKLVQLLKGLSSDVLFRIEQEMGPLELEESQIECTRIMPPSWWKCKLFNGELFPWLFDLNVEHADKTLAGVFGPDVNVDNGLDWELLCRELAMPYACRSGVLADAKCLVNRRRIWDLFESARLLYTTSATRLRYRR